MKHIQRAFSDQIELKKVMRAEFYVIFFRYLEAGISSHSQDKGRASRHGRISAEEGLLYSPLSSRGYLLSPDVEDLQWRYREVELGGSEELS